MSGAVRLSVVIPAYREGRSLAAALARVREVVAPLGPHEIVVVDDGSPDDTWAVIAELGRDWPDVVGLRLSRNFGKEAAMIAGILQARGDCIVVMDADMQHPPGFIPEMVRLWAEDGADIVNAVKRQREEESRAKFVATNGFFRMFSWLSGMDVSNASDFKLIDRRVAEVLREMPERHRFFRGLVAWVGFRQVELPFDVAPRAEGKSSFSGWKLAMLAVNSIISFSALPMHLMTLSGVLFAVLAFGLTARTLWLWANGEAAAGFSTVILLLVLIGALLMIGLGIIGTYIAKIYEEVKGRPRFIVSDRVGASRELEADTDQRGRSFRAADWPPVSAREDRR